MSRHQGVYNMIKHGGYEDEELDEQDDEQPNDDDYGDHNFNISELRVINSLCEIFTLQFTRKDIIDALYETDGDQDAAFEYLSNRLKKQEKQEKQTKPKQQPQIQQQPQIPQLIKQQSNNADKSKNQFHVDYDVEKYNAIYPSIKYKNATQQIQATSIVIVGHVDTGKSTLTGRLLQILKAIDEKEVRRNAKEAKTMGKESFSFAYATDQTKEEKEKGVTMDMAYKSVQINGRLFHLLDSPGHQDFTPHLIAGAAQADYAILVVDTTRNAFENSTTLLKEKLQLLKAMDIKQVIVALNKMDQINWDQKQFDCARDYILTSMAKLGYKGGQLSFVPISAFQGQNIITKQDIKWYQGGTLVDQIQKLNIIKRRDDQPFRFTILNRYHQNEGKLRGTCLFGKLHSGILEKNIQYVILPQGIYCEVKEYEKQEGNILEIRVKTLIESEFQNIQIGSVLCSTENHIPVANRLLCQISTLDLQTPIIRGSQFLMHLDAQKVPIIQIKVQVVVKKMNHIYNDDCVTIKKKFPRAIVSNEFAEIELETDTLVCVETRANIETLSRVVLREKFTLVGIGHVTYINVNANKLKQGKVIHEQQI